MSNYSTVETDKAVIRVYMTDGTMKSFLVTQSQTANAVKFMVCKKLGLDVKEFNMFGLYVVDGDSSSCIDVAENPFNLHVKWTSKNNTKSRFLFKRTDETWPPKPAPAAAPVETTCCTSQPVESPSSESISDNFSYESESSGGMSKGYGFDVSSAQLEQAAQTQRPAHLAKAQTRQGLLGWLNQCLSPVGITVSNLTTDLSDGVVLFRLLELITHKTLKGWHTTPNNMMLKLDNLNMFLRILGYFGIKISGVSPEDIYSGNENIITAILLLIIKKYTPALRLDQYSHIAPYDSSNTTINSDKPSADEELTPPSEEAPLPPPGERPLSSRLPAVDLSTAVATSDGSSGGPQPRPPSGTEGPRSRTRSRMVSPEEQAQLAAASQFSTTAYTARAPPKFAVDATPDISSLLGPSVPMPISSSTPPPSMVLEAPRTIPAVQQAPTSITTPPVTNSPQTGSPTLGRGLPTPNAQPSAPKTSIKMPPKTPTPPVGANSSPPPGVVKTFPPNSGLSSGPNMVKRPAVPPKVAPYAVGPKAPPQTGSPKVLFPPRSSPMASRPLPVPVPKNEPREEMDITFVPQDAMQDAGIPAIEMDFSSPVPGSETAAKSQASRTRANTISNINTNIFDLDAFSDMEDLLIGLADGM